MRGKFRKILLVFVIMFSFIINVNAETKIKEDTSKYNGDVYIIGSSKFDNNVIITGTMASKAGAREAYIQYFINRNMNFSVDDLEIYYYCDLDGKWSLLPATENDKFRDLTEKEVEELTKNLEIYYVNEKEKILEIPYNVKLKEGHELVFGVDDPSKLSNVKYENGKIFVPATVQKLEVLAKDENEEHILLDSFEKVDTEFESKTLVVTTLQELKDAIASQKKEIRLANDISGINETIKIPYSVIFRGAGYKLTFENIEKVNNTASGLVISGEGSVVENLTIEMDDKAGWQGNYGLQVYNTTGVNITNYKGTKADAALLVNSSLVMLQGDIDVSGNEFGGIEVSKGTAEGVANGSLHVNGNIIIEDETISKPAIWLENEQGYVVLHGEYNLVENINIPQALGKKQTFYYTSDSVYKNVNVSSASELLLATSLSDIKSIKLANDIELHIKLDVKRELTLNLNGKTIKPNDTMANDAVIVVWPDGKLTIDGDGTINGAKQTSDHSMAVWVYGGELTIDNGTFTNVGAKDYEEDGTPNNNELIYVSNSGKITINGGKFIGNTENRSHGTKYTLNILDNDPSSIVVKGGTFVDFNPADNEAEGKGTNFVASGYKVVETNGEYTVVVE